jgi:dephospho-CoA kinase
MLVLGIAGGVASGKSEVAKIFESLGAARLDADRIGHSVLADPEVKRVLCQRWGQRILDERGNIVRSAIANIVFGDSDRSRSELSFLESLTHPRIDQAIRHGLEELRSQDTIAVVLDAALMFETGWNRLCDYVVFVDVPFETRRRRAEQRGWSGDGLLARERAQMPIEDKKSRCDVVIDNSGSLEQTRQQVASFWRSIFKS